MAPRTRLGVVGWPVAHSRSPAIQNAALQAVGLGDWRYQLVPVPPELFAETTLALPGAGFRGVNVTIPHKRAALALATGATPTARAIGAANTLIFGDDGAIEADNTDAPALLTSLPWTAEGKSALILGAGGSARAVLWALLHAGAAKVMVWNRTPERSRTLCAELGGVSVAAAQAADLLVNCTSSGLDASQDSFTQLPVSAVGLREYRCVIDLAYADTETALVREARARSIPAVDGIEVLVGQGALSFERFTGRTAPIDAMRAAGRRQCAGRRLGSR